jgi:hypothetical protein
MNGDVGVVVSSVELCANGGDKLHDLQLPRDLSTINAHTVGELGPLPAGGLPVVPKRRPSLLLSVQYCRHQRMPAIRRTRRWISSRWPWRPAWH